MWFVAALSVLAGAAIAVLMPAVPHPPPVGLRERLAPAREPRVTLTLATTFLVLAGVRHGPWQRCSCSIPSWRLPCRCAQARGPIR